MATSGCLAEIAAMSASERPSDFKKAAAVSGVEAAATLPRFFATFGAFALADVESRDLPLAEEANVGP